MNFGIGINIDGIRSILNATKSFEDLEKSSSAAASKVKSNIDSMSSSILSFAKNGATAAAALGTGMIAAGISAVSTYQNISKSALSFSGDTIKAKTAVNQLTTIMKTSGLEIDQVSRKMNAFLASGQDPVMAANLALVTEYMEVASDEGSSAAGHLQDLASGVELSKTQIEDMAKGLNILPEQFLKMADYSGKIPKTLDDWTKTIAEINKEQGIGLKLVQRISQTSQFANQIKAAKEYGDTMDRLKNVFLTFLMKVTESVAFDNLINKLSEFLNNEARIKQISDAINMMFTYIDNFANNGGFERITEQVISAYDAFMEWKNVIIGVVALSAGIQIFLNILKGIQLINAFLATNAVMWVAVKIASAAAWIAALGPIAWFIAAIIGVGALITWAIIEKWDAVKAAINKAFTWIIGTALPWLWNAFKILGEVILAVIFPIPYLFIKFWDEIKATTVSFIDSFVGFFKALPDQFISMGRNLIEGLINGMMSVPLLNSIKNMAEGAINQFKGVFGIASPSKVLKQIGQYNIQGLQIGQEKEASNLLDSSKVIAGSTIQRYESSGETINNNSNTSSKSTVFNNVFNFGGSSSNNESDIEDAINAMFERISKQWGY